MNNNAPKTRKDFRPHVPACGLRHSTARDGLTLLETMLSIALSALVLYLVSVAIDLNLNSLDRRRSQVEEAQLARALLELIANDLRSVVCASADEGGSQSAGGEQSSGQAGEGQSSGAQSGSSGGTSTGSSSQSSTGSSTGSSTSSSTTNISDLTYLPSKAGLYGTQYELQVDVGRLPRPDQYYMLLKEDPALMQDVVSDVKTVAYYVQSADAASLTAHHAANSANGSQYPQGGLFRRVLDRAATLWALQAGGVTSLDASAELIAPEVIALEFQYFDGLDWYTQWDSETFGGLPAAVEITLVIASADAQTELAATSVQTGSLASEYGVRDDQVYRLLVRLPTAEVTTIYDTLEEEESP